MQLVVFFLMVQVMPVYGDLAELGGVEGTVTSDSIIGYQENDVTNFLVADGTIQSAVDNANPGDIINLLERIYRENVHIGKSLSLIGAGIDKTIVDGDTDGDGIGNGRVFYIGGPNIDVTLADMTIRNGNADNDPFVPGYGGGILSFGNLTVDNCNIYDNTASRGGGILSWAFWEVDIATLTVKNSKIHNNNAQWGGGIYNRADNGTAIAIVNGCDVYDNKAEWKYDRPSPNGYKYALGGGILNFAQDGTAVMTIENSDINNNTAEGGGGIYSLAASQWTVKNPTAILNVLDSDIHDNVGCGISSNAGNSRAQKSANATLNVQDSTIFSNTDGINNYAESGGHAEATLQNSDIHDNYGIGISNGGNSKAGLTVQNSKIHNNAYYGIRNAGEWAEASATVLESEIYENKVGGITCGGFDSLILEDSNIHHNDGNGISGGRVLIVKNCSIYNNNGAGIIQGPNMLLGGRASVLDSDLHDNIGDGIINRGSMIVKNTTIHHNKGSGVSNIITWGRLDSLIGGYIQINDSNIYDNVAEYGGGINNSGILIVNNCDISNNAALKDGGGIWNVGEMTVESSNILYNTAGGHGGGIFYTEGHAPVLLGFNQIWGNTPDDIYPPMT
ncbi:MAG: right-handed parallel beta-helix repeat-containing protein [Methanotrichaceae archaeon]|nr:right-handed parallel beta-helix repeat-containing protein [Methanotrichaceae archaeon]